MRRKYKFLHCVSNGTISYVFDGDGAISGPGPEMEKLARRLNHRKRKGWKYVALSTAQYVKVKGL